MSNFNVKGVIKVVKETVQVTEKFSKREFVITTKDDYPQDVSFQLAQDKCSILDGYTEGQEVEVSFNLRGREWTSPQGEVKYFNTLDAWKLESIGGEVTQPALESATNNDLPF